MNSAIFMKSATGLILASSLVAVSGVLASAQEATVSLGGAPTIAMSALYMNAPTGVVSLAGHKFDLTSGNDITLGSGQSLLAGGAFKDAHSAYLLVNSGNSYWWYQGQTAGHVTLSFSDGSTQITNLVIGGNVREWQLGSQGTVAAISDPAATNAWTGTSTSGRTAVIDMLTIAIAGTGKTLTGMKLDNDGLTNGWAPVGILVSAVTVDYTPLTVPGDDKNKNDDKNDNKNDNKDVNRVNHPVKPKTSEEDKSEKRDTTTKPAPKKPSAVLVHQTGHAAAEAAGTSDD